VPALQADARVVCPHCRMNGAQRWEAAITRPEVLWSRCLSCSQIAIWERGLLVFPDSRSGDDPQQRLPVAAQASLLVAALQKHDELASGLGSAHEAMRAAEAHSATVLRFLARFMQYDVAADGVPAHALRRVS
jgi:hypothetical protein